MFWYTGHVGKFSFGPVLVPKLPYLFNAHKKKGGAWDLMSRV